MSGFRTVAGRSCASHEGLALALAEELGCDAEDAPGMARDLAAALPHADDPEEQLRALAALPLAAKPSGALLLPEVLEQRGGDPSGLAVALAVVGQTAGYAVGLIGSRGLLLVAHRFSEDTTVLEPGRGLIDARTLGRDLHWRCAHESAAVVLQRATERAERSGDIVTAIAAEALALALPLDDASRQVRERSHRRLLAKLN